MTLAQTTVREHEGDLAVTEVEHAAQDVIAITLRDLLDLGDDQVPLVLADRGLGQGHRRRPSAGR